jgi:ligand-binding SRPBCC domain-containing protein
VALAEAYLREAGRQQVEISAVSERPELLPFYRRLGYAVAGSAPMPASVKLKKPCSLVLLRREIPPNEVRFSRIDRHGFELDTSVLLPRPLPSVFSFFADASNLRAVTPPWLRFEVLSRAPVAMYSGARISYRARLHGLRVRWNSEITTWDPPHAFVDEQRRGPYDYWRHEHEFLETDEGTLVLDRIRYDMPLRGLAQALFVRRDLERIFRYRQHRLRVLLD